MYDSGVKIPRISLSYSSISHCPPRIPSRTYSHLVNGLAVVSPLLRVPPLRVRVSELPLQWQGRGLGRVGVVAVHVDIFSGEILASLLDLVGRLVGCGLADGGCGIGARKGRGDAGDGHLARDGCALRKAQCSEGRGHGVCVYGAGWSGGEWRGLTVADTQSIQCARTSSCRRQSVVVELPGPAWTSVAA